MGMTAAVGMLGFGTAMEVVGQQAAGDYQSDAAMMNAGINRMRAQDAIVRGEEAAADFQDEIDLMIGAQRASLAAQGIEIDEGTALDVQTNTRVMGELDTLKILNNSRREAWGYSVGEANNIAEAGFAEYGANLRTATTLASAGFQGFYLGSI